MKKRNRVRIVAAIRTVFAMLFGICFLLTYITANGTSLLFPLVCGIIGIICFGISYFFDYMLFEFTNNNTFFTH